MCGSECVENITGDVGFYEPPFAAAGDGPEGDADIDRAGGDFAHEYHGGGGDFDGGVFFEDVGDEFFGVFDVGFVPYADLHLVAADGIPREAGDGFAEHFGIGEGDFLAIEPAECGGAAADIDDGPFGIADVDNVTDIEPIVCEEDDAGDEIF